MPTPHQADQTAIREQAYYIWESEGRPDGREAEFWMRAVVALTDSVQLETLVKPAPKTAAVKPKAAAKAAAAPKLKAAASKTKAAPAKAEPAKKPKKK